MIAKADAERRIVLAEAEPGDVFDIQKQSDGTFLVVRLPHPEPRGRPSKEECRRAMAAAPLRLAMTWDELGTLTREP